MARRILIRLAPLCCVLACHAQRIDVIECLSTADCAEGSWCSNEHACVTRWGLVPDTDGRVSADSNPLSVEGVWLALADGYDADGQRGGSCQLGGHADAQCSVVTTPDPATATFPNQDGVFCSAGVTAQVQWLPSGQADYFNQWGAKTTFDFTLRGDRGGTFDALEHEIRGVAFDIDSVPSTGIRVEFETPFDTSYDGHPYWGGGLGFPPSPVRPGSNLVSFDAVRAPGEPKPFSPVAIDAIHFLDAANTTGDAPFGFCIKNLRLVGKADPGLTEEPSNPPPAVLIDDFEDQDTIPRDERFASWQYYTYNPHEVPHASIFIWADSDAAQGSNGGLNVEWAFRDPPDGMLQYGGVGLRALVNPAQVYLDLSQYSRLVFAHRYQHAVDNQVPDLGPDCKELREFQVFFDCPEYGEHVGVWVPVSTDYVTTSIPLALLNEDARATTRPALLDCLRRVEGVYFTMPLRVADGECGSGHMYVDNVSLR